jgi:hypothetical protein
MKNTRFILLLSACLLLFTGNVFAQQDSDSLSWRIETRDGNVFIGEIVSQDQENIALNTASVGIIRIRLSEVVSITREGEPSSLLRKRTDAHGIRSGRYFYSPNAYGLRKGEGYYQNVWIFFNQLSYGFTDNFTMGVGMIPLFLFAGLPTPVWITPKVNIPIKSEKVNLGAGGLLGTVIGETASFGLAYGTLTLGNRDRNLTFGLGYGMAEGEWTDTPLINISGMYRVGEKGYMLLESYFVGDDGINVGIVMLGGRVAWESIHLDFGGVIPAVDTDGLLVIPWLGLTIPFTAAQ